jgi:hypothetical protein
MPQWVNIAFDSEIRDPRPVLHCEYDGLLLHIKPSSDTTYADVIAVLAHDSELEDIQLRVNRFLSAMAWKDGKAYVTLGCTGLGTSSFDKTKPWFGYKERKQSPYAIISHYDFEHLQNPPKKDQKLALALYRDGLGVNNDFYRFLNFYKIINIGHAAGSEQMGWINSNIPQLRSRNSWTAHAALERLEKLQATESDVGKYLYVQGRSAIAHAYSQPIRDPDVSSDRATIARDLYLVRALAEIFIEQELGVPSMGKIWREHLYELAGFKSLFGDALIQRIKRLEDVDPADFPTIPPLTVSLKEKSPYQALQNLKLEVKACKEGKVILVADAGPQTAQAAIVLDFPNESLELALESLGIDRKHQDYRKNAEASIFRFLVDYFSNGSLEVYNATTGERLSHKDAFIPENIDVTATIRDWEKHIESLEGGNLTAQTNQENKS